MFARTGRIRSGEEGPYAPGGTFDRLARAHGSRESARRRGAATLRHLQGAGLTNLGPTTGAPMERGPDALGYSIMAGDVKGLIGHMERLRVAPPPPDPGPPGRGFSAPGRQPPPHGPKHGDRGGRGPPAGRAHGPAPPSPR